ncbi:hypothetical protein SAMN05192534_11678 [Alteribacillus persepolensis]|uniref:Uncharacterized protein n=1 Tax=Alteribacillus persepolensis TaxID=568899 RepID=A0A1G8GQA3_9BACI|nr:hypothetical protein [Alteribacillus persepolensis]SDH96564.1 hypothetical protein SAMN05192534_11678 [Alteribacillus persepolensis]
MGKNRHYFAGDHTAKGFYTLYDSNFQEVRRLVKLDGVLRSVKTKAMTRFAEEHNKQGYAVEWIHASSHNDWLDAVIVPELQLGVYDSQCADITAADTAVETVHTNQYVNRSSLKDKERTIHRYQQRISRALTAAQASFQTGLFVHDDLEDIYIRHLDFAKANQLAKDWQHYLHADVTATGQTPIIKHRFFGASTPNGVMDYIPNITEDVGKRYFIKGRAGTGKSTFLKKLAAASEELGYNVEMYHCGFDPESIDMIVVRDLDFCVFDSTDPHEYFPERKTDEVIDLYEKTVMPGTDEKYEKPIQKLTIKYKSYMKKGVTFLKKAKRNQDELDSIYRSAADDHAADYVFQTIRDKLK